MRCPLCFDGVAPSEQLLAMQACWSAYAPRRSTSSLVRHRGSVYSPKAKTQLPMRCPLCFDGVAPSEQMLAVQACWSAYAPRRSTSSLVRHRGSVYSPKAKTQREIQHFVFMIYHFSSFGINSISTKALYSKARLFIDKAKIIWYNT